MAKGDCFPKAIEVAEQLVADGVTVFVCHGTPIGTGLHNYGRRYWHAWVEVERTFKHPEWPHPIRVVDMIDRSNDNDLTVPVALGYKVGQIDHAEVLRYTLAEATEHMIAHGHYGPWVHREGVL